MKLTTRETTQLGTALDTLVTAQSALRAKLFSKFTVSGLLTTAAPANGDYLNVTDAGVAADDFNSHKQYIHTAALYHIIFSTITSKWALKLVADDDLEINFVTAATGAGTNPWDATWTTGTVVTRKAPIITTELISLQTAMNAVTNKIPSTSQVTNSAMGAGASGATIFGDRNFRAKVEAGYDET